MNDCPWMDNGERQQIALLTERVLQRGQERYLADQRQLFAEHSAKGMLGSGATITRAVALMGEVVSATFDTLLAECSEVSNTSAAFGQIDKTITALLDAFEQRLPEAIGMSTRGRPSESITNASAELFAKMRAVKEADVRVARYGFLKSVQAEKQDSLISRSAIRNADGKPLANH